MHTKYQSFQHHDAEHGYQNVETAKSLAEAIVKHIGNEQCMNIIAFDNSTTFLAAFVKILKPEWNLLSGCKETASFKSLYIKTGNKYLFVDDFFNTGRTSKAFLEALYKYNISPEALYFYYLQASKSEKLSGIKDKIFSLTENYGFIDSLIFIGVAEQ